MQRVRGVEVQPVDVAIAVLVETSVNSANALSDELDSISRSEHAVAAEELEDVIRMITRFVGPAPVAAAGDQQYPYRWASGDPWLSCR